MQDADDQDFAVWGHSAEDGRADIAQVDGARRSQSWQRPPESAPDFRQRRFGRAISAPQNPGWEIREPTQKRPRYNGALLLEPARQSGHGNLGSTFDQLAFHVVRNVLARGPSNFAIRCSPAMTAG